MTVNTIIPQDPTKGGTACNQLTGIRNQKAMSTHLPWGHLDILLTTAGD